MYTYTVGVSLNDRQVYVSVLKSAAGRCFSQYPYLVRAAKTIVETLDLHEQELHITRDMGQNIGNTNIVSTNAGDTIFYACLLKESQMLRFAKNRAVEKSRELTIALRADEEGNYELTDAWIGPDCPPFPGAAGASPRSKVYWDNHALALGSEQLNLHSMTKLCPY